MELEEEFLSKTFENTIDFSVAMDYTNNRKRRGEFTCADILKKYGRAFVFFSVKTIKI